VVTAGVLKLKVGPEVQVTDKTQFDDRNLSGQCAQAVGTLTE
jgi:hypothetical protein